MSLLTVERRPPIRDVTLDAGKRNALTRDAVEALREALAPDEDAPVVILRGRPDGFSVGLDNATLAGGRLPREELLTAMGEVLRDAFEGSTRIVAVCEGHAVAAGAMLLLVADVRIGVPGAYQIGFTEPRIGMPLPELPVLLARERLDRRRLHELTVLGRTVDPAGAVSAGFLDELAESDDLEAVAAERARELAALGDAAYRGTIAGVRGRTAKRIRALVAEQAERLAAARAAAD